MNMKAMDCPYFFEKKIRSGIHRMKFCRNIETELISYLEANNIKSEEYFKYKQDLKSRLYHQEIHCVKFTINTTFFKERETLFLSFKESMLTAFKSIKLLIEEGKEIYHIEIVGSDIPTQLKIGWTIAVYFKGAKYVG